MIDSKLSPHLRREIMQQIVMIENEGDSDLFGTLRNFGVESLPKGKLLNIGGGITGVFEQEVEAEFPGTQLVTVDPFLFNRDYRKEAKFYQEDKLPRVAAIGQELPFANDAFDSVLSHAALPIYLKPEPEHYSAFFDEVIRVLKSEGSGYFSPMLLEQADLAKRVLLDKDDRVKFDIEEFDPPSQNHHHHGINKWYRIKINKL